jgi:hypothetical protein
VVSGSAASAWLIAPHGYVGELVYVPAVHQFTVAARQTQFTVAARQTSFEVGR